MWTDAGPRSLGRCRKRTRELTSDAGWLGSHSTSPPRRSSAPWPGSVAREFGLHPLAVEDPIKAPLRTKLEHYEGTLFVVLEAARYLDETETVEFGEVDIFVGEDFVVMVLRGEDAALAPM